MDTDLIKLIPAERFENAANQLTASTIVGMQRAGKLVTGITAQSIRTEVVETENGYELVQYGGSWVRYIIDGKPANTKLPIQNVGGVWELVPHLKDWKAALGLQMSDYLLARAIAKNERKPFDVAAAGLAVFNEQFKSNLETSIITVTAANVGDIIKKENGQ